MDNQSLQPEQRTLMDEWKRKQGYPRAPSEDNNVPEPDPAAISILQPNMLVDNHTLTPSQPVVKVEPAAQRSAEQPSFLDLSAMDSSYFFPDAIAPDQSARVPDMVRSSRIAQNEQKNNLIPQQSGGEDSDEAEMAAILRNLKAKKRMRQAALEQQTTPKRPRLEENPSFVQNLVRRSPDSVPRAYHTSSPANQSMLNNSQHNGRLTNTHHGFQDSINRSSPYDPGQDHMTPQMDAADTLHFTRSVARSTRRPEIPNPRRMSDRGQGHLSMRETHKDSSTWNGLE